MAKSKRKGRSTPQNNDLRTTIVKGLTGSAIGAVVFFVMLVLMSFIALKADMSDERFKYMVIAAGIISGFVCGFTAVRPIRKNGIMLGALSALPMFIIVALIAFFVEDAGLSTIGWIVAGVMILFSAVGGILAVNKRK